MQNSKLLTVVILSALLSACSTLGPPAGRVEEPGVSADPPTTSGGETIAPISTAPSLGVERAVSELLRRSWELLQAEQWRAALSSAERAQRLDRFEPESYLVIATAHYRLAQHQLAANIAAQGLSYATVGSDLAEQLEQLVRLANAR